MINVEQKTIELIKNLERLCNSKARETLSAYIIKCNAEYIHQHIDDVIEIKVNNMIKNFEIPKNRFYSIKGKIRLYDNRLTIDLETPIEIVISKHFKDILIESTQ